MISQKCRFFELESSSFAKFLKYERLVCNPFEFVYQLIFL